MFAPDGGQLLTPMHRTASIWVSYSSDSVGVAALVVAGFAYFISILKHLKHDSSFLQQLAMRIVLKKR